MKRQIFAVFALALLLSAAPALAQDMMPAADNALDYSAADRHPPQTAPSYVAMVFYKMAGRQPNFEEWIRQSDDYKSAPQTERAAVRERMLGEFRSAFSLLTTHEPITLEMPVRVSAYSEESRGFFIDSFKADTFLPVAYNGQSYAIVPQGLMDKQWISVSDQDAIKAIMAARTQAGDKGLTLQMVLLPQSVDASSPAQLEGGAYWLIAANIGKMMLFGPDPKAAALWQSEDSAEDARKRQELLNLRQ